MRVSVSVLRQDPLAHEVEHLHGAEAREPRDLFSLCYFDCMVCLSVELLYLLYLLCLLYLLYLLYLLTLCIGMLNSFV